MNWPHLREFLLAKHSTHMQNAARIERAIALAEEGLGELARLGHRYHLVEGPPPDIQEWPKVMFHMRGSPEGRVVQSEHELAELGPGWYTTIQEAWKAAGIHSQFSGRGGVKNGSLPAVIRSS